MSKREPDYVYIWGIGWYDRAHSLFSGVFDGCGPIAGIIFLVLLVAIGVGVVESIFPWLPWL